MIIELLVNNIVLILMVVFLVLMALWGRHRGFFRMIASTAAMVISLFVARGFMTKLSAKMMEQEPLKNWVEAKVIPKLTGISVETVFNALSFLLIFVVTLILLRILASTLDRLTEGTPLSIVNEVFGLLLGLVEAVVFLWVFMIFVDAMPQLKFCEFVSKQIQAEPILKLFHDNNLVVVFLQSVLEKAPAAAGSEGMSEAAKVLESSGNAAAAETTAVSGSTEAAELLETVSNP